MGASRSSRATGTHREDELRATANESFKAEPAPSGSFIAEGDSFSRAPLNSRLPPVSPHRVTIAARTSSARLEAHRVVHEDQDGELTYTDREFSDEEEEQIEESFREVVERKREGLDKESLEGLDPDLQEALVCEDLLFVLMGIEGQYIEFDPLYNPEDEFERLQGAQFMIDPNLDPWLASAVARFIPIATYYTSIQTFVEQYSDLSQGVINHALCAAIREMLREYLVLLAQLEHQFNTSPTFTLQRFWYYLHPTLHTLSLIHSLTSDLVLLNLPSDDDDSSSGSTNSSDSSLGGGGDEGLRAVLAEMKGAAAGIRSSSRWTAATGPAKGGEVLAVLASKLERTSGDPTARELYTTLLLRASQPYVAILVAWVTTGQLADPWDEFIVKETKGITRGSLDVDFNDEYWERRYTLRDKAAKKGAKAGESHRARGLSAGAIVPAFLDPWKNKILLAGKYLNVIRECGIEIKPPEDVALVRADGGLVAMNDEAFFKRIDNAYTYANRTLLQLLLSEQLLLTRLRSLKQYFFVEHGDAITLFLDLAKYELTKRSKNATVTKLQSLLELALRGSSSSAADPFKDDLTVVLHPSTLTEWLVKVTSVDGAFGGKDEGQDALGNGLMDHKTQDNPNIKASEAFTFDYRVRFPLNLVISKKTVVRYQLVFRYLLQLKLLERLLADAWTDQTKTPIWRQRSKYPELEQWKSRVFALRARMFAFVQQMFGFAVAEVLEPNWRALEAKLSKVETVDQLLQDHVGFLDDCLNSLLLTTNEKILKLHNKMITCCEMFAAYTITFTKALLLATKTADHAGAWSPSFYEKQWDMLEKFEKNFNHHFETFHQIVGYTASRENPSLLPLHVRLEHLKMPRPE
ncbi:hypothetical protein RQP46_001210 [Phenoliferia psychrophenolica]